MSSEALRRLGILNELAQIEENAFYASPEDISADAINMNDGTPEDISAHSIHDLHEAYPHEMNQRFHEIHQRVVASHPQPKRNLGVIVPRNKRPLVR
jgi:hypothetical protein